MPALARAHTNPYPYQFQQDGKRKKRAALGTHCPGAYVNGQHWRSPRCIGVMTDTRQMHHDHGLNPAMHGGTRGERICCRACNCGAGAIEGNRGRGRRRAARRTRSW